MLRLVLGLFVSVAVARYLGPKDFGLYNYVLSIVALVAVLGNLGLQNLAKRELVATPEARDEVLGTCFVLSAISGVLAYGLMLWVVAMATDSSLMLGLFALLGGQLLCNPFKCSEIWFQSQVRSDLSVKATSISLVLFAVVKIIAIAKGLPLLGFAYIFLLESITVVGIQTIYYLRNYGPLWQWRILRAKAGNFLSNSWPLIVSGLAVMVYMRIDQVMLGAMVGEQAVGEYAAATRISNIWHFIPQILATSLFPAIMSARKRNDGSYENRLQRYFDLNASLAYAVALATSILAPWLIEFTFGAAYEGSANILAIHAWSTIFVFLGVARSQYLVAEQLYRISMICTILGAVVNVILNYLWIPPYGGNGAATATLVSYALSAFFSSFIFSSTRRIGRRQLISLAVIFRSPKKTLLKSS